MATQQDLNITVVYSEGGVVSPRAKRSTPPLQVNGRRWLGCVTLLVAAVWLYVTWFPVRHFLGGAYCDAVVHLPGLVDWSQVLGFKPPPPELANPAQPAGGGLDEAVMDLEETPTTPEVARGAQSQESLAAQSAQSQAVLWWLTAVMYAWLGTMTVVACWLAMTGGAGIGGWLASPGQARPARVLAAMMLTVVALITWEYWPRPSSALPDFPRAVQFAYAAAFALLAWAVCASSSRTGAVGLGAVGGGALIALMVFTWLSYKGQWPVRASQTVWFGVMVVAALAGAARPSWRRGLTSGAIVLVLSSCVVTAVGLWYAQRHGGFGSDAPTAKTYVKALVIQSSFAWILLVTRVVVR
ncbi:MAG: hypothetical protein V2A79_12060 [Planctomycetota bacterium]